MKRTCSRTDKEETPPPTLFEMFSIILLIILTCVYYDKNYANYDQLITQISSWCINISIILILEPLFNLPAEFRFKIRCLNALLKFLLIITLVIYIRIKLGAYLENELADILQTLHKEHSQWLFLSVVSLLTLIILLNSSNGMKILYFVSRTGGLLTLVYKLSDICLRRQHE